MLQALRHATLLKKRLQHSWFQVKFEATETTQFVSSNSNNLFEDIPVSYAQQIFDDLQLSQWQTNLKMHSFTKMLFGAKSSGSIFTYLQFFD